MKTHRTILLGGRGRSQSRCPPDTRIGVHYLSPARPSSEPFHHPNLPDRPSHTVISCTVSQIPAPDYRHQGEACRSARDVGAADLIIAKRSAFKCPFLVILLTRLCAAALKAPSHRRVWSGVQTGLEHNRRRRWDRQGDAEESAIVRHFEQRARGEHSRATQAAMCDVQLRQGSGV